MGASGVCLAPGTNTSAKQSRVEKERATPLRLRLDGVPATAANRERMRIRLSALNRQLEESGAPFRLRLL